MVGQEAKGVDLPLRLGASLTGPVKESLPVRIIGEDGLAAIAAVHDVIDGSRVFQAQVASLAESLPGKAAIGQ